MKADEDRGVIAPRRFPQAISAAIVITFVVGACLERLVANHAMTWLSLPIPTMLTLTGSIAILTAFGGSAHGFEYGSHKHPMVRVQAVVLIAVVVLLSLIGFLARVSLAANAPSAHVAERNQLLIGAVSVAAVFATIQVIVCYRVAPGRSRMVTAVATTGVVALLAWLSWPGKIVVLPASPGSGGSPRALLAITAIAVLVLALAEPRPPRPARRHGARPDAIGAWLAPLAGWVRAPGNGRFARRAIVPGAVALIFFGYTRDLSMAIAVLSAGIAVLIVTDGAASGQAWLESLLVAAATFAIGVWPVTELGGALGDRDFSLRSALGYGPPRPAPFLRGKNIAIGPGWPYRMAGRSAGGPDVLAVIGRETGALGLAGVALLFILLFAMLILLAVRIRQRAAGALARGLIAFLAAQFALAAETLVPGGVPLGEGPPLLAGGWAGYAAAVLSIAIVIGLAWRAPDRPSVLATGGGASRDPRALNQVRERVS